jgi:phosphoribosyl-AMP cyclohydrolase
VAGERRGPRPVAVVDAVTGEPLMLAYADDEALRLTVETGLAHFYSRSRESLWLKGQGSGSTLEALEVLLDCDRDAAAYIAYTGRHVCHLGRRSCFHNRVADRRLEALRRLLEETRPYTRIEEDRVLHPLVAWQTPPEPLLAALAAQLLAEAARRRGRPGAVLSSPPGLLGLLVAQRLRGRLHLSPPGRCGAPESIGEEDRVAVVARWPWEARCLAEAARRRGAVVDAVLAIASREPRPAGVDAVLLVAQGEDGGLPRVLPGPGLEDLLGAEQAGGGPGEPVVEAGEAGVEESGEG